MLSPEIWNFSPPTSSFTFHSCPSEDVKNYVKKQLFNHHVSITIPDAFRIPQEIINVLVEDSDYYRINDVPINEMINKDFIKLFAQNGRLTALSIRSSTHDDSCLAFTPHGECILVLNKYLVQTIGIPFKNKAKHLFHVFVLDVLSENFTNPSELDCYLANVDLKFDILLMWEPDDEKICPSSIANYFYQKGYFVKTCKIQHEQKVGYNLDVPVFNDSIDKVSFLEWVGAFNLHCNLSSDSYLSTFNYLDEKETFGQVCVMSFTGFFSARKIDNFISKVQQAASEKSSSWICIVLKGFDWSPIKCKNNTVETVGDHHHVILLKSGSPSLVSFFSTGKKYKGHKIKN